MRDFGAGAIIGLFVGAVLMWMLGRGDLSRFERERDEALARDSVARAEVMALRTSADSLDRTVAVLRAQLGAALDDVDSLVARGPRVIRVTVPSPEPGGPAVPIDVVTLEDFRQLETKCSAASVLCRRTTDSLTLLAAKRDTAERKATARADDLAAKVAAFTVPKDPGRFGIGVGAGYGAVYSNGQVCGGPGAFAGATMDFRLSDITRLVGGR